MNSYKEHYRICRGLFDKGDKNSPYSSVYELGINLDLLELDRNYYNLVDKISQKCSPMFDSMEGCFEDKHAIRLNDWSSVTELEQLAQIVMPQIENKVFHSNLKVEFVHPYRNKINNEEPEASWRWHYDDCPKEFIKFFLHLNDVTEDNGCFQYLSMKDNQIPIVESARPSPWQRNKQVFPNSRVPKNVVETIIDQGGEIKKFTGPRGSYAILTPNIMHRATIPKPGTKPREIIVFFMRPTMEKSENYILGKSSSYKPERNVKQYLLD